MRFNLFTTTSVAQLLVLVLIISPPVIVVAQKSEPCKESLHSYRSTEHRAITKVEASYSNERGVWVKGRLSFSSNAHNESLDASGGSMFRNLLGGHGDP